MRGRSTVSLTASTASRAVIRRAGRCSSWKGATWDLSAGCWTENRPRLLGAQVTFRLVSTECGSLLVGIRIVGGARGRAGR
jgi:hypothetical protein